MNIITERILSKILLSTPILNNKLSIYKLLYISVIGGGKVVHPILVGSWKNVILHKNAEINRNCFLLAKDKIEIGENSILAYGVTVLTSANPNGPHNKLSLIYPAMRAPVIIGDDVWVGANATILPGIKIGNYSVIASGSVVTKDVPSGVLVAGNPAVIKRNSHNFNIYVSSLINSQDNENINSIWQ